MRKYPSNVSVSENCIDGNLEMVKRRDPDNFPPFPATGMVRVDNTRNCPKVCEYNPMERNINLGRIGFNIFGDLGRSEINFRDLWSKTKDFQGAEDFFSDLGRSMHYFKGAREHRPPPPPVAISKNCSRVCTTLRRIVEL